MEKETSLDPSFLPASTDSLDLPMDDSEVEENRIEMEIESVEDVSPTVYLGKALVISVAYSANCGGAATLIGTPVNPVMTGIADE